jgi:predicted AlkP superfamily pyrophosphatase or phosphodiesterase
LIAGVALVIALGAAYTLRSGGNPAAAGMPANAPTEEAMATDIGAQIMEHLYRGHVPGRSGDIMLVPKPYSYLIGEWDLTTLGTDTPEMATSHPNPWDYLARVPIIVYGPRYAPAGRVEDRPIDISALAPTYARLLGMEPLDVDGSPLPEVRTRGKAPKLIFTVVIDGGGWNALREHPEQWPFIDGLRDKGLTYVNATIGSAPSITGALHATFGTGDYPMTHRIPGNQMRDEDGANVDTWLQNADPRFLESPTVSELWDEQNANKPIVATVSYEGWHLGMIGHGAQRDGGDRDIAVLWEAEENEWWINEDYYELPGYLQETELDRLERYEGRLDPRDGLEDGAWFGHTLEVLQEDLVRPGTPAFVKFTGDAVVEVIEREPFGKDALTDLMWVEMKMPDYAGHAWNVTEPEQGDVILETDRQMARMKKALDAKVGKGNYLFVVSADHGQQPLPELFGGWRINNKELERDIVDQFGVDILEKATPVDVYMDRDRMEEEGIGLDEVARYLGTYTIGDNVPDGAPGADRVPDARLDEVLFAGAFSTDYLQGLSPEEIASFGDGIYPEGDLTIGDDGDEDQ